MALELQKEQVLLAGTLAVLGLLYWKGSSAEAGLGVRPSRAKRASEELALTRHAAPDTTLAERRSRPVPAETRDLFAPPRDTRPLAPLAVAPPPIAPLSALRPPSEPGPAPAHYGRFLRADASVVPVPGLFAAADEALDGELLDDPVDESGGFEDAAGAAGASRAPEELERGVLSPEQRAAELESFLALYDWIRINEGDPLFGRIENPERYGLARRALEAVLFVELDPRSGLERFPGMQAVPYARERVIAFGFADTASNWILTRRAELAGQLSASSYAELLTFADECVRLRREAREALRVAEESYLRAAAFDATDPTPLAGLARCYEVGFRLEEAWGTYQDLIQHFAHRPEGHVGLAGLEARLRLFESAEERLRHAASLARVDHRVQAALGRFLLDRGRATEALVHLRDAYRFEPSDPSAVGVRAEIRADLGEALLAAGGVEEALSFFDRALSADPLHQRAQGGRLAALDLGAGGGEPGANATVKPGANATVDPEQATAEPAAGAAFATGSGPGSAEGAGFALLLAQALIELGHGDPVLARDQLLLAAESDPLRAHAAWRALSWLAETRGYPEEAVRWIEEAHQADPTDAWTLYQRGRLLSARGDQEGARESLMGALDRELAFPDALIALGELAYRAGDHASAELYFERALAVDPARAEVHALRGENLLEQREPALALVAFEKALELDPEQPLAHAGRAWTSYLAGDAERAITLFAELDDRRRALPEDDPYRSYAREQLARLTEHLEKEAWSDGFERRALKNGWTTEEAAGPEVRLEGGALVIQGTFKENGATRVLRLLPAADFVSFAVSVTAEADHNARAGVFLAKERRRGAGVVELQGMVSAAREKGGGLALLAMDVAAADPDWVDVPELAGEAGWWPAGRPVRILIERVGEGSGATARVFVDGVLVREGIALARLSSSNSELLLGIFVEGQTGLPAHVEVDDVELVYEVHR